MYEAVTVSVLCQVKGFHSRPIIETCLRAPRTECNFLNPISIKIHTNTHSSLSDLRYSSNTECQANKARNSLVEV